MVNCKGNAIIVTSKHINRGTRLDMLEELLEWPAISGLVQIKMRIDKLDVLKWIHQSRHFPD